ncbi:MAG: putative General secretion pathway protein GspG [Parcubacteria group bacterium Gr01-1014_46]|nr:MAG: putative General secretion pathway protein GspG [Parcubacteria group bacterium Gr01-1014_46]
MIKKIDKLFTKGFTLIELLVVIAIIGVLSSIILTSLNSTRGKGADAKIKSELNSLFGATQLFYDTKTTLINWNGVCSDQTFNISNIWHSATKDGTTGTCGGGGSAGWKVYARLSDGKYWCVDYTSSAKTCDSTVPPAGQSGGLWICQTGTPYNCK